MALPTNQSAVLRVAQFFRLSDIRRPVPQKLWSSFPGLTAADQVSVVAQAKQIVATSQEIELAGNGGSASGSVTLYPDSETVEYRVKVKFTRSDGTSTYRTYRNRTDSSGGIAGILEDIESFIGDISRRYGYESYDILFDSLIVWGN